MTNFEKQRKKTTKLVHEVGSRAADFQTSSTQHVKKYVTRRAGRIVGVRRFVVGWLLLVLVLSVATIGALVQVRRTARVAAATTGGTYTEGVTGSINNLNPLFTSGTLDDSTARLLFNGLFRYDTNGALVPDLAKDMQVDDSRKIYTITLREDVKWHDNQPFTAEDVAYTINAIKNPETRSTLFASWQSITVKVLSKNQVSFELPAPFAPFPTALTVSILPQHLLAEVPAAQLRTSGFNTHPVGTGPFVFSTLRDTASKEQQIELSANKSYYRGAPKLSRFILHTYADDESLARALREREITAAVDLKLETVASFNKDRSIRSENIPLNSGVFAFFKTTSPNLGEAGVRTALAQAIDRQAILELFNAQYAPLKNPLLSSQLGFDPAYSQQTNVAEAEKALDAAGWVKQANGIRAKNGSPLELGLTTVNSAQYSALAGVLQKQWAKIGVSVKPQLLTLEQLQQNALSAHAYDILLYGISIGHDPDVYAYWHSSQARVGGLNFSEWKSSRADSSLEVARTRLEPVLREARYKNFQDEWLKSTPAVALYQPRVNYSYHQNATGFVSFTSNNASDRLTNVEDWTVGTRPVEQTP